MEFSTMISLFWNGTFRTISALFPRYFRNFRDLEIFLHQPSSHTLIWNWNCSDIYLYISLKNSHIFFKKCFFLLMRTTLHIIFKRLWLLFNNGYLVPQSIILPLGSGNIISLHWKRRKFHSLKNEKVHCVIFQWIY